MLWRGLGLGLMLVLVLVLVLVLGTRGDAAADDTAPPAAVVRVADVPDGQTLVLADGRTVRLAGLHAPADLEGSAPPGEAARAALARLVRGRAVILDPATAAGDRYGRLVAHVKRAEDGLWVQGALLRDGLARVESRPDQGDRVGAMLALEAAARAAGRGLWALDAWRVRDAAGRPGPPGSFQLVEGRIVAAARVRGHIYLNFGTDWRRDFTAIIAPGHRRRFERAGLDPVAWTGRRVRVRGWLYLRNGPMIDLTHPEQVELLDGG